MKLSGLSTLFVLSTLFALPQLHAEEIQVKDSFDSINTDSSEAFNFARKCIPSITERTLNNTVLELQNNATSVTSPQDQTKPYMAISKEKIYCVQMSVHKYPILPRAIFDATVNFPDMEAEDSKALKTDLSQQIAKSGYAVALVVNETGAANEIVYMLATDRPLKVYYHLNFLKKGEFSEERYASVYKVKGGISVVSRGAPGNNEWVKYFFVK